MHSTRSLIFGLTVLLMLGLISGCGEKKGTATPGPDSPIGPQQTTLDSPVVVPARDTTPSPAPEVDVSTTPIPVTPAPGKGVVTGVLTRDVLGLPLTPVVNTRLFLAKMLTDENDPVGLASLDENKAPASLTNASGYFVFFGLEPGKYALIIKTPVQTRLAHDVVNDVDVVVEVVADQVTELGDIHIETPY